MEFILSAMWPCAAGIGIGTGRLIPSVAAVVGLIGVVVGGLAFARTDNRRSGASLAVGLGLSSLVIGGLHAANSGGGVGTGNGLAGAIVAMVVGLSGMVLGGMTLVRPRKPGADSRSSH